MKVVLLAGGLGTRMREETEYRPKPMVEIGGRPVIWHLMKLFAVQGLDEFVVATGYKSDMIKDYFLNYEGRNNDFTITLGQEHAIEFHGAHDEGDWRVTVAYTGEATMTGGRVHRVGKYLGNERFMCTYGDGLADVDIASLLRFHESHGRLATVTTVQPLSRFGVMDVGTDGVVELFRENPGVEGWIKVRDAAGALSWAETKSLDTTRNVLLKTAVAVRQKPADDAPVVFEAQRDLLLEMLDAANAGWVHVKHRDGATGYVRAADVWGG